MNCPKCSFNLGDMQPNYCPNCGKKIVVMPQTSTKKFRRVDYLGLLDREHFSDFWNTLSQLDVNDAYTWLQSQQPATFVYVIEMSYNFLLRDVNGKLLREEKDQRHKRLSVECVMKNIVDKNHYRNCKLRPTKFELSKTFSPYKCGNNWWWTKEDCQKAIEDIVEKVKKEDE